MGRRSSEEPENHWPGFVDALSTIVMVVTFLLIILSIAIFVLSQSLAKSYIESQAQITEQGGGDAYSKDKKQASKDFKSDKKSETVDVSSSTSEAEQESQEETTEVETTEAQESNSKSDTTTSSNYKPQLSAELTDDQEVDSEKELSVLSRKTDVDEQRIVVASADKSDKPKEVKVLKTATILTLQFDKSSVKIDEASSTRVSGFVESKGTLDKDTKLTIWSFTGAQTASVSEAKRIAYYRALTARNELLKNGFEQDNISVEIRFGTSQETHDTVQIVVTPNS